MMAGEYYSQGRYTICSVEKIIRTTCCIQAKLNKKRQKAFKYWSFMNVCGGYGYGTAEE